MENAALNNNFNNIQDVFHKYNESLKNYFGVLSPRLKEMASKQLFNMPYKKVKQYLKNNNN